MLSFGSKEGFLWVIFKKLIGRENEISVHYDLLDLQQLKTFGVVAATCNFTRAAAELGYSQSTVTAHIQGLERELGTSLFERARFSKTVVLTAAGQRALEYGVRLLALAAETKNAISSANQ